MSDPFGTSYTSLFFADSWEEDEEETAEESDVPCERCGFYFPARCMTQIYAADYCPSCADRIRHPEEFVK